MCHSGMSWISGQTFKLVFCAFHSFTLENKARLFYLVKIMVVRRFNKILSLFFDLNLSLRPFLHQVKLWGQLIFIRPCKSVKEFYLFYVSTIPPSKWQVTQAKLEYSLCFESLHCLPVHCSFLMMWSKY